MQPIKRYLPEVPQQLRGFSFETLEADPRSVFAVSRDLTLIYVNPAYCAFAEANGGSLERFPIGSQFLDSIVGDARDAYGSRFLAALAENRPWHHEYLCHSPDTHREFQQSVYPLKDGTGLVVINSHKIEAPIAHVAEPAVVERYVSPQGFFTQCSNCRRMQRCDDQRMWDWVPAWVAQMPENTSHSICPPCYEYYWQWF